MNGFGTTPTTPVADKQPAAPPCECDMLTLNVVGTVAVAGALALLVLVGFAYRYHTQLTELEKAGL